MVPIGKYSTTPQEHTYIIATFRKMGVSQILRKLELVLRCVKHVCASKRVQLKSNLQDSGTCSAVAWLLAACVISSSTLPLPSSHCDIITTSKNLVLSKEHILFLFVLLLKNCVSLNLSSLKLSKSGGVKICSSSGALPNILYYTVPIVLCNTVY